MTTTDTNKDGVAKVQKIDKKLREFICNGNLWAVIIRISLPLMLINALTFLYNIVDSMMAAKLGSTSVSAVVVLSQISSMLTALGSGMASGGMIIISRLIGRNHYNQAKTVANTIIIIAVVIGILTISLVVPLTPLILKLARTPESLIAEGTKYFRVQIITAGIMLFNSVFLGLEKARGQTKTILALNFVVIITKILLSYLFIYVFEFGLVMISVSTLIANSMLTVYVIIRLNMPKYLFKFNFKDRDFSKGFIKPYVILAFPIFLGRFVFTLGKVWVNSMCSYYGEDAVGALGVSNNLGGYVTNVIGSVEESAGLIISTNLGQKNKTRALNAFYYSLILNTSLAVIGVILMTIFDDKIIGFYAKGDAEFARLISNIFKFEKLGIVALAFNSSMLSLLYGYGFTKISLITNLSRLFVFRIPSLYIFMYFTNFGVESIGLAMFVSNGGIGLMSIAIIIIYLIKIKRKNLVDELKIQYQHKEKAENLNNTQAVLVETPVESLVTEVHDDLAAGGNIIVDSVFTVEKTDAKDNADINNTDNSTQ